MSITAVSLADGQLPGTKGTLLTATAPTHITFFQVTNTDSSTRTINIYICRYGSSSRRIIAKDYSMVAGATLDVLAGRTVRLASGDTVEGDASSASKVDYLMSGGKES